MGKTCRDKRDIYYRCAKLQGFRARSAYKLLQIDKQFGIFEGVERAVDLWGAPGGWSQVIIKRMKEINPDIDFSVWKRVVNVDLQTVLDIDGVTVVKGDITRQSTVDAVLELFEGEKADLVASDGAPDVTGNHEFDQYIQHQLVLAAVNISMHLLKEGGTFVAKVFRGKDFVYLSKFLKRVFKDVIISKPKCCRNSSIEGFIVWREFHREDKDIVISEKLNSFDLINGLNFVKQNEEEYYTSNPESVINISSFLNEEIKESEFEDDYEIEFVSWGDETSFDPDMNYSLLFDVNTGKIDGNKKIEDYEYINPFPKIID